jgi:hypothetical protein
LDLRNVRTDEEIWAVLDLIEMRGAILDMGDSGLDMSVAEGVFYLHLFVIFFWV